MLSNYIKLALRLLARNPFSTFVNVLGLSAGFAAFFILWQYAQSELESDQFHKDFQRIVRFGMIYRFSGYGPIKEGKLAINDPELVQSTATEFGEVEDFTRVFVQANFSKDYMPTHGKEIFMSYTDNTEKRISFVETNIAYGDSNLFSFFNFPLKQGNPETVLSEAYTVVISEATAKKYFGEGDALGKTLSLNGTTPLKVTGIFEELPRNTHLSFDMVISSRTIQNSISKITITDGGPYSYLKLRDGTNQADFEGKLKQFANTRFNQLLKSVCNTCDAEAYLQPLREVPFNAGYWYDAFTPKSKDMLLVLSVISILILVAAWINYVNLAITANLKRIKELAARKTVGAKHFDFIKQFVMESSLVNFISVLIALIMVQLSRSPLETLLQFYIPDVKDISTSTMLISAATLLLGILFTGIYPALITLKHNPRVLFGTFKSLKKGNTFTNVLTTLQFSFAVILIIWIFSVHLQLDYILHKDIGIRKDHVVTIDLPITKNDNFESTLNSFSNEVARIPGILDRTVSNSIPGVQAKFFVIEKNNKQLSPQTNGGVDEQFIPLYGIKLLAGRNFQSGNPSDQHAIIISRTTTVQMGLADPAEAIGQRVDVQTSDWGNSSKIAAEVIGVIDDYKVDPLFSSVNNRDGIALTYKNYLVTSNIPPRKISLLVNSRNFLETISTIESLYSSSFPEDVFHWNFLDQQIGQFYIQEKTTRNQITFFTLLAIGIACLGLLGIIRNKVAEKTKEMGVRKVLGAEFHHLTTILLNTTVRQIILAIVIGAPVATFLTQQYLQKFSERISLQWWHYVVPVVILVIIMMATIASTLIKVGKTNPVDALRYE